MKAIFSIGPRGEFGVAGGLCYKNKLDLRNFKRLTVGRTVWAGAKTLQTLPALPNRTVRRLERGMEGIPEHDWLIGGATVLRHYLQRHKLTTCVVSEFKDEAHADTFLDPSLLDYMVEVERVNSQYLLQPLDGDADYLPEFDLVTYLKPPCTTLDYGSTKTLPSNAATLLTQNYPTAFEDGSSRGIRLPNLSAA